ncbi:MAG TPA: metallophosphoesterase family protein, partial [Chloroflexota bacterium]
MARRIGLLSDIHGNLQALLAVQASLPTCDQVVVAGDFCLEGPQPAEVLDLLQELGWMLVVGNADCDVVSPPEDLKPRVADIVRWTREQLGEQRLVRLGSLPRSVTVEGEAGESILVVHANPKTLDDHLYPTMSEEELEPYLEGVTAPMLAFGHLHIPYVRPVKRTLLIDVSSVGHPKDGDRRAAFTLVEWSNGSRSVTQKRVPYD